MTGSALIQDKTKRSGAGRAGSSRSSAVSRYDYRTPSKFPQSFVREFDDLHKEFMIFLSERYTRELRSQITIEHLSTEQLTYDAYVRSMPNPSLLNILELSPLPGRVVFEMSTQLGLVLVDRLLGGPGRPVSPRPPTVLEQTLLTTLTAHPMSAFQATLSAALEVDPQLVHSEMNPQFAHAAASTDTVIALTFSLTGESDGHPVRGLISICYPSATVEAISAAIKSGTAAASAGQLTAPGALSRVVPEAPVEVSVQTRPTKISAADLTNLQVGEIVLLDHRSAEPLVGFIESIPFMEFSLGRQEGQLAARLERWTP